MKKLAIVSTIAALISTTVFAGDYAEVTYNPSIKNENTKSKIGDGYGLTAGHRLGAWAVDFQLEGTKAANSNSVSNDLEGRVTYDFGPAWVRGGLGRTFSTGTNNGYATYAVGSSYALTKQVSAIGSIEYTDSFKSGVRSYTTYQAGLAYAIDPKNKVAVTFNRALGGQDTSGIQLGYTRGF